MGWWKNGKLHGNSIVIQWVKNENTGEMDYAYKSGWYENGQYISDFRYDEKEYFYWEYKEDNFIKDFTNIANNKYF